MPARCVVFRRRSAGAALAHDRVVAIGQVHDELMDVGGTRRGFDLGLGRVHFCVGQVRADGIVEQVRLLRHHADRQRKRFERHVAQVMPVDADDALGGVIQAWDEIRHRGFARAGGTDQRDQTSGTRDKGDPLKATSLA